MRYLKKFNWKVPLSIPDITNKEIKLVVQTLKKRDISGSRETNQNLQKN